MIIKRGKVDILNVYEDSEYGVKDDEQTKAAYQKLKKDAAKEEVEKKKELN